MTKGWPNEPQRHALASKGIETASVIEQSNMLKTKKDKFYKLIKETYWDVEDVEENQIMFRNNNEESINSVVLIEKMGGDFFMDKSKEDKIYSVTISLTRRRNSTPDPSSLTKRFESKEIAIKYAYQFMKNYPFGLDYNTAEKLVDKFGKEKVVLKKY